MRKLLLVVLCGMALVTAAPAMAANPTQGAYSGTGANQLSQVQSDATSQSPAGTSGTLPFTGMNLGLVAGVAITLMGSGLVLRRRTRSMN